MTAPRGNADAERGAALLVVIAAVALLTITVMEFTFATQVEYRRTAHWLHARQADLLAGSGVTAARTLLFYERQIKRVQRKLTGGDDKNVTPTGLTDYWARFCPNDGYPSCPSTGPTLCNVTSGSRGVAIRVEDETGRYNLNRLASASQAGIRGAHFSMFERLFLLVGLDPRRTGPIIDWIDPPGSPYAFGPGAEAPEYFAEDRAYVPRDAPMRSIRELALVLGISHGEMAALRRVVSTLDPREVETFNVNTAPAEVLRAFDDGALEPHLARLESERCREPFRSLEDLRRRMPDLPQKLSTSWIHFESDWFRVRATAHVGDVYQSVEALLRRADTGFEVVYYLPRRGPNIGGVDMSEPTTLEDVAAFALDTGGPR